MANADNRNQSNSLVSLIQCVRVCEVDVVNPNGSGVGGEVGGFGPNEPTSVAGQTSGVNVVGCQTEPMVCVTNRDPMDFTIKEAKKYMRTE